MDITGKDGSYLAELSVRRLRMESDSFPLTGKRVWGNERNDFLGRHVLRELAGRQAEVFAPTQAVFDLKHPGFSIYLNQTIGLNLVQPYGVEVVPKVLILGTVCVHPKFCPTLFREDDSWNGYLGESNAPFKGELPFNPSYPHSQPKRKLDTTRARERFGWQVEYFFERGQREAIVRMREVTLGC
jgi:hypothetical protein